MHPFKNFAYAKLNLDFDHKLFAEEYDRYILPSADSIATRRQTLDGTRDLNQSWGMVDPVAYDNLNVEIEIGTSGQYTVEVRGISGFAMNQLLELVTVDSDSEFVKNNAGKGGSLMRNHHLNRLYKVKPEFKHLKIVEFILKQLPFKRIVNMHCVSLEPGSFSNIHRDARYSPDAGLPFASNAGAKNGLFQQGHVIIVLNISDGGVPLWWALDGVDNKKVSTVNDSVYLHSDYFLHGVPICTSRRRQIRITGIPSSKLNDLIDHSTKVVLLDDYKFDDEKDWYPG
jgi:hypothetical protein